MKRIFLIFLIMILLCGCNSKKSIANLDIKQAGIALDEKYTNMTAMDKTELEVIYGLNTSLMEEYVIKSSTLTNGNFYALIKVDSSNKSQVQNDMKEMFNIMEKQSNLYSAQAVSLIKNHLETSVGNYLIYIVSENNSEMYNIISEYIK